ncbi:hypothetical protein ACFY3N_11125 [Streptomyces sp. NPDC000348]|uniref:hypothetical protein n=1 Tax=Streptomyces sp. NPDC000348 TaxID=3364538 RepID=UPI003687DEFC
MLAARHAVDGVTGRLELSAEAVAVACRELGLRGTDHPSVVRTAERILRRLEEDPGVALVIGEKD